MHSRRQFLMAGGALAAGLGLSQTAVAAGGMSTPMLLPGLRPLMAKITQQASAISGPMVSAWLSPSQCSLKREPKGQMPKGRFPHGAGLC